MNKKVLLFTILVVFMFNLVRAEQVTLVTPESSIIVYAGYTSELEVPIKNEGEVKDIFYFSVWPSEWISMERYWMSLNPGESSTIKLFVSPPITAEEGKRVFIITSHGLDTKTSDSKLIYISVQRKTDVFISEVKMNKQIFKPDEILTIQPVLKNMEKTQSHEVYLTTSIMKDNMVIKKFEKTVTIEPKSLKTITHLFSVERTHVFGDYVIEVVLRDAENKLLDKEDTKFKIERVYDMLQKKTVEYGLFYTTVKIEIINNGNVPNSNFTVTESVPRIAQYFFHPEIEPEQEEKKDNRVVYLWTVKGLSPGETRMITYRLRFINVFFVLLAIILLILVGVWVSTRPVLSKRYRGILREGKEVFISLHIKNRGRKQLKNIIVKDFVPSIARVIRKFDTITPELKRKSTGTELIWSINKLKPKEEVILTYRIKPIIEIVGEMKLPKAYFTHETKKGKKRKVVSKTITIKGKVK